MLIDIHSHIAPGVDDGAADISETREMLRAAKRAGVTHIVATSHLREPNVSYIVAYNRLNDAAREFDISILNGYEVALHALIGLSRAEMARFCTEGTRNMLVELPIGSPPPRMYEWLEDLSEHFKVIIAHPERYRYVQQDMNAVREMRDIGCRIQISAGALIGRYLGATEQTAQTMIKEGLVDFIASDAHAPSDYDAFARVYRKYAAVWPKY